MSTLGIMKGTTNAQRNAVVGSSSAVDKLTLTMADGTTQQHTVSDMIPKDAEPTTGSAKFVTSGAVKAALDEKVDAEAGKGLSTNDYTTPEKNKLAGISAGAQVNVIEEVQLNGAKITPSSKAVNIDLSGYATKGDLSAIPKFAISVVTELPSSGISTSTIYLKSNGGSSGNSYDEYIYVNSAWEKIGTTEVDLSGYVPKTTTVNNKQLNTNITLTAGDVGALPAGGTAVKATADANGNNIANTYATQTALTNGLAAKQNTLTFDSAPTSGSSNPVTSGGVFSAINNIEVGLPATGSATQPIYINSSGKPAVCSLGAAATMAVDSEVKSGSGNLITSGAVYNAINNSSKLAIPIVAGSEMGNLGSIGNINLSVSSSVSTATISLYSSGSSNYASNEYFDTAVKNNVLYIKPSANYKLTQQNFSNNKTITGYRVWRGSVSSHLDTLVSQSFSSRNTFLTRTKVKGVICGVYSNSKISLGTFSAIAYGGNFVLESYELYIDDENIGYIPGDFQTTGSMTLTLNLYFNSCEVI